MLPVPESEYGRFVFIDIGAGKGATLLYACDLGFRGVIGVELVKALHEIAEANIRRHPRCGPSVKSVCCDATTFRFPEEPLIVFANNPFSSGLMNSFLDNLGRHPKEKYFIHESASYSVSELPCGGFLRRLNDDPLCRAYAGQS